MGQIQGYPGGARVYSGGVEWRWWRRKKPARELRLGSRATEATSRIDLAQLTPTAAELLAHAAASQLVLSAEYARVVREAWSVTDQDELARANAQVLAGYEKLRALLSEYVEDPQQAMLGPLEFVKQQMKRMNADNWYERVATCLVVGGFLADFFRTVSLGLPDPVRSEIHSVFERGEEHALVESVLGRVFAHDEAYRSQVSLWSRRLVGDTMLIARHALKSAESTSEEIYEPLFTDIVTEHSKRLDRLGLTA